MEWLVVGGWKYLADGIHKIRRLVCDPCFSEIGDASLGARHHSLIVSLLSLEP